MKPHSQYTKSGSINIAYQVFGTGSIDLVYIPGWVSNIDLMWACPELVNFLLELGKFARVILFDKRGTGLSDRIVELSTLEERMDDIRAVMDAVGSKKAVLFGHSEGGSVSALFAATFPNRTISLITFGIFAKRKYTTDYPWAPTMEERQKVYDMIENNWGSGKMNLETLAPSKANDSVFMDWIANYLRSGASPRAALELTKMNTEVDITGILGSIQVPTLILQRKNDIDVKIEEGRFIAKQIPKAKFIELEGEDHLFWVGNTKKVLDEMKEFILNENPRRNYEQKLYTIAASRIHADQRASPSQQDLISKFVSDYRGNVIQCDGRTFIATFEGPSKAVHCHLDLLDTVRNMGAKLSVGIHIKEGSVDEAHFVSGETERFLESILKRAKPNQIIVTQTIKYLLSGVGLNFAKNQSVFELTAGEPILLYTVSDNSRSLRQENTESIKQFPKYGMVLERVLQCIDLHLDNELFGVESLCREIGINQRQLQRKLKAMTNKSPNQLITSVRLHRAKELLLQQGHNVAEVAYQTGFSNPSYFSKSFKKEFGLRPSELLPKNL